MGFVSIFNPTQFLISLLCLIVPAPLPQLPPSLAVDEL